jgi:prepilin-type N-terminal cleavage/methylation domain-containing protein
MGFVIFLIPYTKRSNTMKYFIQKQAISREKISCRRISGQEGFTLIEVLLVIAIFSIGILGAMSMQTSAVNTNALTRKSNMAIEYATDTMERLMQIGMSTQDNFNVDDDELNGIDDLGESELNNDGIDNDDDGSVDEADELEWFRLPEFADGGTFMRGGSIPADAYYSQIFNLTWEINDVDCDGDGTDDAKRIDMTVAWVNNDKKIELTGIRTNLL